ncbi:MAG: DNA/RNA nuclease SfsA [Spirochaetaceae bacterium]|jgi:sugar fermentation stimulation protein A|nr:DNA/RNA nuclease SfsA [Spirochaetaceae bacterium]
MPCEQAGAEEKAPMEGFSFFTNDREALFVARPNRFLIIAQDRGETLACHCPNPGRLIEYLFPNERLILEKRRDSGAGKTRWTAAGICRGEEAAPLFCARANQAAEQLILRRSIPDIQDIRAEYPIGRSRFDFLCVDRQGARHLVEVKACSLIEHGIAMFPDAPSARALKHLEEMEELGRAGYRCHLLFVILHSSPRFFMPNIHTDPAFALGLRRFHEQGGRLQASLIRCGRQGGAALAELEVPIDLSPCALAEQDRGSYLMALEIPEARRVSVGALGDIDFEAGWYIYAGSAQKGLSARMSRHLRRLRKRRHWHIDYLTPYAKTITALPVRSYQNLECRLAGGLKALGAHPIHRFGSSDCACTSHLFYLPFPPLTHKGFVEMLLAYRARLWAAKHDEAPREGCGSNC